VTAEYRHFRSGGHQVFGERPAERADFLAVKARVIAKHRQRHSAEAVARVVGGLRAEAVAAAEAAAARAALLESERQRFVDQEAALATDRDALAVALAEHRDAVREQGEHIARLHAEIDRLNSVIGAMEGTKAWRLHRAVERLRGR